MRTKVGQTLFRIARRTGHPGISTPPGQVQNVRIFGQPQGDGVKVIVAIQTRAVVNEIEIDGATGISAKSLRKKIKLKVNAPLDEDGPRQGATGDHRRLPGQGIQRRRRPVPHRRATKPAALRAWFTRSTKAARARQPRCEFEGNTHFSDRVLRKQMKTKGEDAAFPSSTSQAASMKRSCSRTSMPSANITRTTATSTSRSGTLRRERGDGQMILVIAVVEGTEIHRRPDHREGLQKHQRGEDPRC